MAVKEEDEDLKKQIEVEMITGTLHAAVLLPVNLSAKFMHVSFSKIKFWFGTLLTFSSDCCFRFCQRFLERTQIRRR